MSIVVPEEWIVWTNSGRWRTRGGVHLKVSHAFATMEEAEKFIDGCEDWECPVTKYHPVKEYGDDEEIPF